MRVSWVPTYGAGSPSPGRDPTPRAARGWREGRGSWDPTYGEGRCGVQLGSPSPGRDPTPRGVRGGRKDGAVGNPPLRRDDGGGSWDSAPWAGQLGQTRRRPETGLNRAVPSRPFLCLLGVRLGTRCSWCADGIRGHLLEDHSVTSDLTDIPTVDLRGGALTRVAPLLYGLSPCRRAIRVPL